MKTAIAICVIVIAAGPAKASDLLCRFATECFENEACQETEHEIRVSGALPDSDGLTLETQSETLRGSAFGSQSLTHVIFTSETAWHLLSTDREMKTARYTVHMQGPLSVTYLGACEASE